MVSLINTHIKSSGSQLPKLQGPCFLSLDHDDKINFQEELFVEKNVVNTIHAYCRTVPHNKGAVPEIYSFRRALY